MKRKKANKEKHNTRIAILFVLFVFSIILISIIIKGVHLFRQSKFDGSNRFTISVTSDKNVEILSFSPINRSITILKLDKEVNDLKLGQFLKIPIDGFVKGSYLETDKDVSSFLSKVLFGYKDTKTNLNIVDLFKLILASRSTPSNNLLVYSISALMDEQKIYKIVEKLLKDEEIEKENQTIEIVNSTEVMGLGGNLATFITNMGGNVIQVATNNNLEKNSYILYNGTKTYTVKRLKEVLGFRVVQMNKKFIAEIKIVLGEDVKNNSIF